MYVIATERSKNVTFVMGPSGSGKSAFSRCGLPGLLFEAVRRLRLVSIVKYFVTVFLKFESVKGENFEEIKVNVLEKVKNLLRDDALKIVNDPPKIKYLFLCVVIDEAGFQECDVLYGKHQQDGLQLQSIVAELEQLYAAQAHVVMVGTGLEKLTQSIDSSVPFLKLRMREWNIEHFKQIVAIYEEDDRQYFGNSSPLEIVERHAVLESLD